MSFLSEVVMGDRRESKVADVSGLLWANLLGDVMSKAGVQVNIDKALRISTVFACAKVVGEDIGKLPFRLMREAPNGRKTPATEHPLHWLIYRRPNDWMTSQEFREMLTLHAVFCKGGFAFINRASDGRILELLPLLPGSVTPRQLSPSREVVLEIRDAAGIVGTFPRDRVLFLRGLTWNGVGAMQLVDQAREVLGLSLAIEESQERLYANGARPSGVLSTENELKTEARDRLKRMFADGFQSVVNSGKVPILDNGLKFVQMAMSSVDAQTLESRRFQVEEVCRMMRVYPQKVMHTDKTATFAAAEQFHIAHGTDTIDPWAQRWCHAVGRDCLTREEVQSGLYPVMYLQAMMRGDAKSRAEYYKASLGTASSPGWNVPNDIRRLEDQDPLDDPGAEELVTWRRLTGQPPADGAEGAGGKAAAAPPALSAAGDDLVVQDTALNGAQVTALQAIVDQVAHGQLPAATARAMIRAAFPAITEAQVDAMLKGLDGFTPAAPAPAATPD